MTMLGEGGRQERSESGAQSKINRPKASEGEGSLICIISRPVDPFCTRLLHIW